MNLTKLFRLRKPEGTDPVNVEDFNDNFDVIDEELGKRPEKTGNASDMVTTFTKAENRVNLTAGEKIAVSFGKIMKFFADLKNVAFSGAYTDLSGRPTLGSAAAAGLANNLSTTATGFGLDARQGPVIDERINQISSDLGSLSFAKDKDGNWGYKVGGADPVIPFSTASICTLKFSDQSTSPLLIPSSAVNDAYKAIIDKGGYTFGDKRVTASRKGTVYISGSINAYNCQSHVQILKNGTVIANLTGAYLETSVAVEKSDYIQIKAYADQNYWFYGGLTFTFI